MDEQLSATTAHRMHWTENIFYIPALTLPTLILFRLNPMQGGVFAVLGTSWDILFHSNLRLIRMGRPAC